MSQIPHCKRSVPALPALLHLVGLSLLCASFAAHATLGSDVASVYKDKTALDAKLTVTKHATYTDYVMQLPKGGEVHEYADKTGHVFQITWGQMGSRPNMAALLGDFVSRFSGQRNGGSPMSRHADRLDDDFELHSKVVNRYFSGMARLPNSPTVDMQSAGGGSK